MRSAALGFFLAACAIDAPTAVQTSAVTNGTVDLADPAVVALVGAPISCGDPLRVVCSGTLISPRVVLTAAHCVSAVPAADALVYIGADVSDGRGELIPVDHMLAHPDYAAPNDDVGLIVLARPASITPASLRSTALDPSQVGAAARIVGFGADELGGLGVKREGNSMISAINPRDFVATAAPATSCNGDSGGPVFVTANAAEEVAGITSFGDVQCTLSGTNMRVDAYRASFIDPNVANIEASTPPPARPEIDPSVDYCAASCTVDAECPSGMGCVTNPAGGKSCGIHGTPPGRFGGACGTGGECAGGLCMAVGAGCLCYSLCAAPMPPGGGCAIASAHDTRGALVWIFAAFVASRCRVAKRRRTARR